MSIQTAQLGTAGAPDVAVERQGPSDASCSVPHVALVHRLAQQLDEAGVACCLWKGTFYADRIAAGDKDIDLLVLPSDRQTLLPLLSRLGFREARGPAEEELPGTANFFGYDCDSGGIVHLHVHYELVVGHPLRSMYRLPLEKAYLVPSERRCPFPIPQPELELLLFCFRMLLDRRSSRRLRREAFLSADRQREYAYLRDRANPLSIQTLLQEYLPNLQPALVLACIEAFDKGDAQQIRSLARGMQNALRPFRIQRDWWDVWKALSYRASRAVEVRVFGRPPRKHRFVAGGLTVAMVGGDGAGKSTAMEHLRASLSRHFDVQTFHLGKPTRSLTTHFCRGALKAGRIFHSPFQPLRFRAGPPTTEFSKLVWHFCAARDRYLTYLQTRRAAADGCLVLCDRWPLPDVMAMDGPQIRRTVGKGRGNWLVSWMGDHEERWHQSIPRPDCMIVLKVDPVTALQRKPEEDPEFVRLRGLEVWNAAWSETTAHVVDASQLLDLVLDQVKRHVWKSIVGRRRTEPREESIELP